MCCLFSALLTVGVFVRFSVAGGVILDDRPVDAVAQTFVHVHCHLVGDSNEEVYEEATFPTGRQEEAEPVGDKGRC